MNNYPQPKCIQHLATLTTYAYACKKVDIEFNGNQMCSSFSCSPQTRSGLFNKHLNGMTPSVATLRNIEVKAEGSLKVFHSPIWDALDAISEKSSNTLEVLEKQDIDVLRLLFESERAYDRSFIAKKVKKKIVFDLRRLSTESALAALIILRQEKRMAKRAFPISKVFLDRIIYWFLINLLACNVIPYTYYAKHCFRVLSDAFNWKSTIFANKPFNETLMHKNVIKRREEIKLLASFRRSWTNSEKMTLLNKMDEGYRKLIELELLSIKDNYENCNAFELNNTESQGLYWALSKINRTSVDVDKFNIHKGDNNKYVLTKRWFDCY